MRLPSPMRRPAVGTVALAIVAYVPLLLTHRGKLGADTKAYLYLDPAKLLSRAPYMWDPGVGLGTVTHQNIGYLFPMGPYYWLAERVGLPDWIAQRLWMGSILFLAGLGVRWLLRTLAWERAGVTVASFAYALSPYLLHYIYKHSVILLPFVALPWLLHFTIRSLRRGGWRDPAWFALVALAAGGVNATSLLLVLIGPGLWLAHAVVVERDATVRQVLGVMARIGALSAITSLWWVIGLSLQGQYGIDILRATETYKTVSDASSAPEVSRALGYWFFYGIDVIGPWFKAASTLTQNLPAMALSFAIPTIAMAAALWTRFRYRIFFALLTVTGVIVSVGAHPNDHPSPYGEVFRAFADTRSGLAMRSTPRAIPLVALGLAVFLGAGVAALSAWRPQRRLVFASVALVLIVANLSQLWTGRLVDEFLERPDELPSYWPEVGQRLNEGDPATRTLEVPGSEFANYRWGSTVDPITPGLTDRDYAARELVPYGSPASADLMTAVDSVLQDASLNPAGYSDLLRLLGVGDLVVRNDLEYERFRTPRPRPLSALLDQVPGLDATEGFGPGRPNIAGPTAPLLDDLELALDESLPDPPEVEVRAVQDPEPMIRVVPDTRATVLSGDGAGVVAASEAGLLDPTRLLAYSATARSSARLAPVIDNPSTRFVITDTNRKAGRRWGSTKDNIGATEMVDETPAPDPSDFRLPVFEDDDTSTQSVAVQRGGMRVTASGYGNPLTYTPGDRAVNAADGDPTTAWRVGAFSDVRGEWIRFEATDGRPLSRSPITLTQPNGVNRRITTLRAIIDDDRTAPRTVRLDESSWSAPGQQLDLGPIRRSLLLEIVETDAGIRGNYQGLSGVGISDVRIGERTVAEFIRPPVDTFEDATGLAGRLSYVLRRFTSTRESGADDPEPVLRRIVRIPTGQSAAAVRGTVRLAPRASDAILATSVANPATRGSADFAASGHLLGDTRSRAWGAFDGDPMTAWRSNLDAAPGAWVEMRSPVPVERTVDRLVLVNDGRHSQPVRIHFEVDGTPLESFEIGRGPIGSARGERRTVRFAPVTLRGSTIRLVIDEVVPVTSPDWLTDRPVTLPVGIAELSGTEAGPLLDPPFEASQPLDASCRDDLLTIGADGVPVRLNGRVGDALAGHPIEFEACGPVDAAATVDVVGVDGRETGWNVDMVVLEPEGNAAPGATPSPATEPNLTADRTSRTSYDLTLDEPLAQSGWLVLGQSFNQGWELSADGVDLGPPTLINGYANGWRLDPDVVGNAQSLRVTWAPQRTVWIALALSLAGVLLCLALGCRPLGSSSRLDEAAEPRPIRARHIALLDAFGTSPSRPVSAAIILGSAAGAAVAVGPLWAAPTAAVALVALTTRWGWWLLRGGAVAALGLGGAYVVAKQWRNDYPLDFNWPQLFDAAHQPMMWAWVLLLVECAVEAVRAGWRRDADLELDQDQRPTGSVSRPLRATPASTDRSTRS